MDQALVSVVIPCYNEHKTIKVLLEAILSQTYALECIEVVIADALSTDGTREQIEEFQEQHPEFSIRVVDNPRRIIAAGLNLAIRNSTGDVIMRMDAHAIPAPDYIEKSITALQAGVGANVGGVIDVRPGANTWIARSIAIATSHPLGVGDARYRYTSKPTEADTVAFGSYTRALYDQLAGYDESLLVNEDYEFNTRIRQSGGKIWVDPAIRAVYFSRPDLRSLAKQYFTYGFWKFKMLQRYPSTLRWRQALPPLFLLSVLMLLLFSFFFEFARILLVSGLVLYAGILLIAAVMVALRKRQFAHVLGVPLAIMTMHFSWGAGFWWSIIKAIGYKRR
jgi:glycosyltransferase involved in cell wall biosynthesis